MLSARTTSPDLVFRAFSDRTRLRILNLLQAGGGGGDDETCVCELVRIIDAPQPKISRHLAYLRRAGLVKARKEGLWMHYRLAAPASDLHRSLLHCLATCFKDVPELQRDLKKLNRPAIRRPGNCC